MKTQIAIAAALSVAGSASAAFQVTSSFATFSANVAGQTNPIVFGDLLYATGSGNNAQAGSGGLSFNANSSTGNMSSAGGNTVTVGNYAGAGVQVVTISFPGAGTFPVRGFGIYYTGGTGSPFTVFASINGANNSVQTVATGSNNFLGFYQDSNVGLDITNVQLVFSTGNGLTITGSAFALVPAPGAMALLGVASLVSTRRRR